jgi:hypothetical protein
MSLPVCPLMSGESNILCVEDQCAWYIPQVKKCAVMVLGYESAMRVAQPKKTP